MEPLEVESVDFHAKWNAKDHHTDKYAAVYEDPPTPVLRMGQPFHVVLTFKNRNFQKVKDAINLVFSYDDGGSGHEEACEVTDDYPQEAAGERRWAAWVSSNKGGKLKLKVLSPANAPVGAWKMEIQTSRKTFLGFVTFPYPGQFFLLFNPWNKNSLVYMPETILLDEYVLEDVGKIWIGLTEGSDWVFGQFEDVVLQAAMLILKRTGLSGQEFGDPVKLTRALTRVMNSEDDVRGVLKGKWPKDGWSPDSFEGGKPPYSWTGSVDILKQYLETEREVKFGQCWVFSGILTTVCRALGIPTRPVTCIQSGRDHDGSLTIDSYVSKDKSIEEGFWNFHVWSEAWMSRPDLPPGYDGWQAVDATNQERSDGFFQCGPAPVTAVYNGDVNLRYDVGFLLASVNGDVVTWQEDPNSEIGFKEIECNTRRIGEKLFTKKPLVFDHSGVKDAWEITNFYKPPEGSPEEREIYAKALIRADEAKRSNGLADTKEKPQRNRHRGNTSLEDADAEASSVSFKLQKLDNINNGENLDFAVYMENESDEERTVEVFMSANTIYYNGVRASLIKKEEVVSTLQPKTNGTVRMTVEADEYLDKLVRHDIIQYYAFVTVKETEQSWLGVGDVRVIKPPLRIIVEPEVTLAQPTTVVFQFKNPLKNRLTNCRFSYEGPRLGKGTVQIGDVEAEADAKCEVAITPTYAGPHKLVALFSSQEINDVTGSVHIDVLI